MVSVEGKDEVWETTMMVSEDGGKSLEIRLLLAKEKELANKQRQIGSG